MMQTENAALRIKPSQKQFYRSCAQQLLQHIIIPHADALYLYTQVFDLSHRGCDELVQNLKSVALHDKIIVGCYGHVHINEKYRVCIKRNL